MLEDIEDINWNAILDSIHAGNCIPFLGAGVNVTNDSIPYEGLPLANEVSLRLARSLTKLDFDQIKKITEEVEAEIKLRLAQVPGSGSLPNLLRATLPDLSRVALEVQMGAGYQFLLNKVREILPFENVEPSPMLKTLAGLKSKATKTHNNESPFKLIVTTNYDGLLERAFDQSGLNYIPVVQYTDGIEIRNERVKDPQTVLSEVNGTIIYKIHGTFSEMPNAQKNKRLILTEEDYIEFLSNLGDPEKGVPPIISSQLRMGGTILFLGYGLQDWDFRVLYKTMIESIEDNLRPQSFAIQKSPPKYLEKYWTPKGINILNADLYSFATELQTLWNQFSPPKKIQ